MITIILAAGYATRLYPLTENFPKPLLEIGGNTILGRLLDDLDGIDSIDSHIVVTNHRFAPQFQRWAGERLSSDCPGARSRKSVSILDDGTSTNETRLGAVRDLLLAIERYGIDEDIFVLAADNILDFSLSGFVEAAALKGTSMIMCHAEPSVEKLRRTGVVTLDADGKVLLMQEKPQEPASHWAVPPFYIYCKSDLPLIRECLEHGCGFDAPGNLARYLADASVLHAWEMPAGRFDIGSLDTYEQAKIKYAK